MQTAFGRTSGLDEGKASLGRALAGGKFPHALLIHGPEGMGQNALALDLVDLLLCEDGESRPCGRCPGCLGRLRGNLDNLHFVLPLLEKSDAGDPRALTGAQVGELTEGIAALTADPYGYMPAEKAVLRIAQIGDLQGKIAYAMSGGRPQVAVLLGVEAMDAPVANALLKTLEEPPANTYFILTCGNPGALLPTIVSRCTRLPLFPMPPEGLRAAARERASDWNLPAVPERLLPFAEGSPGILLDLHRNGGDTLIGEAGRFFSAALDPASRRENGLPFADYLEASPSFEDLASAARLLGFLLRALRLALRLRIKAGAPAGPESPAARPGTWTRAALDRLGLDPSLAEALSPLEAAPDLHALADWLEETLGAVRAYAKPRNAALGLYLEWIQKGGESLVDVGAKGVGDSKGVGC